MGDIYEETSFRRWRVGVGLHGLGSGARGLRHRQVWDWLLPDLGPHRRGSAGWSLPVVEMAPSLVLPFADTRHRSSQAASGGCLAPVLSLELS